MVAVGNLDKVWLGVPEGLAEWELNEEFRTRFGAAWTDALDSADASFAYNAGNDAYFAVRHLRPVVDLSLDELLKENGSSKPPNIIVS